MTLAIQAAIDLPFSFDPGKLKRDLETAMKFEFATHPLSYHDGSWQVINLIYAGGKKEYTHEGAFGFGDAPPAETEVLVQCPYFREVIDSIPGEKKMVRLSALPAGGRILRHYDPVESIDLGVLRLHMPIVTSRKVIFKLASKRQLWEEGKVYYGDFTFPHSVFNRGTQTRVHMILDLEIDAATKAMFPVDYLEARAVQRRAAYRQFHRNLCWYQTKFDKTMKAISQHVSGRTAA